MSRRISDECNGVSQKHPGSAEDILTEDHANVNFPPPMIHFIGLLAGWGLSKVYPLQLTLHPIFWWLGLGLVGATLILTGIGVHEFIRAGNPVRPNRKVYGLMTSGPFRFTRNPLYLALALLHAGVALVVGSVWLLVSLLPVLILVRYYVIAREEAYLTRRFGQAYLDYQSRVRRWI